MRIHDVLISYALRIFFFSLSHVSLTDDNDNLLFCFAGSAHQDRSAGGYQGHGRHGGEYSVSRWLSARLNCFLTTWIRLPTTLRSAAPSLGFASLRRARSNLQRFISGVQKDPRLLTARRTVCRWRSVVLRAGGKGSSVPENKRNAGGAHPDRRLISFISEKRGRRLRRDVQRSDSGIINAYRRRPAVTDKERFYEAGARMTCDRVASDTTDGFWNSECAMSPAQAGKAYAFCNGAI